MGLGRLALPVAVLAARLVPSSEGYSLNVRPASAASAGAGARKQSHPVSLKSTTTGAAEGESTTSSQQSLLRRDSWPASKRRRVKGAIKRRARRLARVRKKNKTRQDALELATVNDVARLADSTYFPAGPDGRAAAAAAATAADAAAVGQAAAETAAAEQNIEGPVAAVEAAAGDAVGSSGISVDAASYAYDVAARPPSAALVAATSKRPNKSHATIKGRPIVKGGKGRGLWRSIFGPRPLLEVHSLDQLSQLVDVEGWGLEDLSVFTGGGVGPRRSSTESVAANTTVAATASDATAVAAGIDGVPQEAPAAASAVAKNRTGNVRTESGGTGLDSQQATGPATTMIDTGNEEEEEEEQQIEEEDDDEEEDIDVHLSTKTKALPSPQGQQQQQPLHPSVQAVLDRAAAGTAPSLHRDGRRIGLAIEGGGMRGCVAAGMASCLHFLGLADSFDCVYGASAGSLIGEIGTGTTVVR